ncbi:VOC family protein [Kribbella yunnanensis]|uniref:VOC family protein n=1 Tax=Kribbella yunnanensis TaxID=190194 RepID=A0ABN2H867_9ACTN
MTHFTSVHTVGIPVTDQDRALEFYTKTLGFTLVADTPLPQLGGRWIVVAAPSGASLALTPATETGLDTGIRLGTPDAAATHQHLTDNKVTVGDLLSWPGIPPMFTFQDPDNNTLYTVQD